mgnify:CR=1 FL=1
MNYTSFEQINKDLAILKLKRKIAVEEIRGLKNITSNNLNISNWINPSMVKLISKYGVSILLKKIVKKAL